MSSAKMSVADAMIRRKQLSDESDAIEARHPNQPLSCEERGEWHAKMAECGELAELIRRYNNESKE